MIGMTGMTGRLNASLLPGLLVLAIAFTGCKSNNPTSTSTGNSSSAAGSSSGGGYLLPSVALPQARNAEYDPEADKESSVVISIVFPMPNDVYVCLGREVLPRDSTTLAEMLKYKLEEKLKDTPPEAVTVYIRSDRLVKYGKVVEIVDAIREAGYDGIGLVVEKEGDRQSAVFPMQAPMKEVEAVMARVVATGRWLFVEVEPGGSGPDQTVALNRQLMPLQQMGTRLAGVLNAPGREDKTVFVKAPKDKPYADVVAVIDVVKKAGAEPIGFAMDEIKPPREIVKEAFRAPSGTVYGVPGGVPGGVVGGVGPPPPPPPPRAERAPESPKLIRKSGGALASEAISKPEPPYPPIAKAARASGPVVVEVTIDEKGNVISAQALSGHPLLKDAAVQAAQRWKFRPTLLGGAPVKVIGTITFNFKL